MPHYYLEGLENDWHIVRETPHSQIFRVNTENGSRWNVDVHYTPSLVATVSLCFVGKGESIGHPPTDGTMNTLMDDLSSIILKRGDYQVIDYTLCSSSDSFEGNFAIDDKLRRVMNRSPRKD